MMSLREELIKAIEHMSEEGLKELIKYARLINAEEEGKIETLSAEEAKACEMAWQDYLADLDKGEPLEKVTKELLEER
ncbi:MAG: hypothetical protein AB1700_21280 [Bacillota bacterium]